MPDGGAVIEVKVLTHLSVLLWLLACAVQDWRRRQVDNRLTLMPMFAALLWWLIHVRPVSPWPAPMVAALILLAWRAGWIGGADAKASLALALFDPGLLAWAWCGVALWYLALWHFYARKDVRILPGFVGFAAGVGVRTIVLLISGG